MLLVHTILLFLCREDANEHAPLLHNYSFLNFLNEVALNYHKGEYAATVLIVGERA